ncbi:MAG: T9SS type A sorting domain-containing protein [Ignavibacteriae bacterium]|nr:T9SS type A sorting domain-containing protein [Ignavibacteriota bacterium]
MYVVIVLLSILEILFSVTAIAQRKPSSDIPLDEQAYSRWLITGKGNMPRISSEKLHSVTEFEKEPEIIGDIQTEVEYYKRVNGEALGWTPEQKLKTHQAAQSFSEERNFKNKSVNSPPSEWTLRGPVGMRHQCNTSLYWSGRVSCLDFNSTNGLYVGAASGGLWAPVILFFVPIADKLPTLRSGSVALHPTEVGTIYYGTGEYSTQGGGGGTGTYKTTDNGANWTRMNLLPTPTHTSKVLIAPWNNNTVYVAGNTGLYVSYDNGDNWSRRHFSNVSSLECSADSSVMLLGSVANGVYRSTDQGWTWDQLTTDLPTNDWRRIGFTTLDIATRASQSAPIRAYVQIARVMINGDTTYTGNVEGVYRCDDLLANPPRWTNITPMGTQRVYHWSQGWIHNAIEVHPTNQDLVWLGGGTLLKSTNAGGNWIDVAPPHADIKVIKYRTGDNLLYLGGDGGLFTSTNDGTTWSSILNQLLPTTMFYNIDVCKTDDRVVFGSSQDNATEGTSIASPSTWRVSNIADGIDATVDWSDPLTVFATTQFGDVFRTTNGGVHCPPEPNWPWLNNGLQKTSWSAYVYQDPSDANWVYYNGNNVVYYSTNKGTNWNSIGISFPKTVFNIAVSSDGQFLYTIVDTTSMRLFTFQKITLPLGGYLWFPFAGANGTPSVRPIKVITSLTNPSVAYSLFNGPSATQRVFKTTDNGVNWQNITGNFTQNIPLHDLVESPVNSNVLWLGTDQGVYKSTNGGTTWWWWNKGMPDAVVVNDMEYAFSAGGDYLLAGTFGRSVFERNVNAPVFSLSELLTQPNAISNYLNTVLVAGDSGRFARSTDGGNNWSLVQSPSNERLLDVFMIDSLFGWVVGRNGNLMRTSDGGNNWEVFNSPTSSDLKGVFFTDDKNGFLLGADGAIYKTTNSGTDWETALQSFNGSLNKVLFTHPNVGWAVGTDVSGQNPVGVLYSTFNGGSTWYSMYVPGLNTIGALHSIHAVNPYLMYAIGEGGKMFKTTDFGQSWNSYETGFDETMYSIFFRDENNGWACGQFGTIIKTTDGGTTWSLEESETSGDLLALRLVGDNLIVGGATGVYSKTIEEPITQTYSVNERWNLLSIPLGLANYSKKSVFPTAVSDAFSFNGQYVANSELQNGVGYWMKFQNTASIDLTGYPLTKSVIEVQEGWNLIGSLSSSVPVYSIIQEPAGVVESNYYGYEGGYAIADAIEPAKGYWVKANQAGRLILDSEPLIFTDSLTEVYPDSANLSLFDVLTFSDGKKNKQQLFVSTKREEQRTMLKFIAPPLPPEGAFDVRFKTGRLLECADLNTTRSIPITVSSASYPLTVSWDIQHANEYPILSVNGKQTRLDHTGTLTITEESTISLSLAKGFDASLPKEFSLEQNYPNPFNPITAIHYQLPVDTRVSLKVFNMLGQEVATLVEGEQEAGYQTAQWNASGTASGVYIYRLTTSNGFTAQRKMALIR